MSEVFDAYHKWLGIPPAEQPANHYRLLGIEPLETDPDVIESAADQRMAHLRTHQTGKQMTLAQELLRAVAAAKYCLLDPTKKRAYDAELRQKLAARAVAGSPPAGFDVEGLLGQSVRRPVTHDQSLTAVAKGPSKKFLILAGAGAAAALLVLIVAAAAIFMNGSKEPFQSAKATEPAAPPPSKPSSVPTETAAQVKSPQSKLPQSKSTSTVASPPKKAAAANDRPEEDVAIDSHPKPQPPGHTGYPVPSPSRHSPPSVEEQKRLMAEIDEVYKQGGAKVALARKLLEDGRRNTSNRAEQFVLLRRAGEIARDAGNAELMLEAVDAIVAAGFDIRPFQVKARWLKQLVAQSAVGDDFQLLTASTSCVKFAEAAAADGAADEASEVLDEAKKSLAEPISKAQTALRVAKAALARAHTPAEKTERAKTAEDAQAELDGVKSTQAALVECAKVVLQTRRDRDALQAARDQLKTAPDDPVACLVVGRWCCFHQGDWDEGMKLLAKGSDNALKSLAADELASKPATAKARVARGDAWWDVAEKEDGKTKAVMRQRAGRWYQEALPDLPSGLAKAKVEKRLAELPEKELAKGGGTSGTVGTPALTPTGPPELAVAPFDEKAAAQHQARWAKYLGVSVVQVNSIGMKLVLIPPGEFVMGSPKDLIEKDFQADRGDAWNQSLLPGEWPPHRVRITRPYWLGATPVTQEEYQRVMGVNPSMFRDPRRPVERVTADDAAEFCRRLSELPDEKTAQRRYELPTEAQWEHACRAGTTTRYYSGDDEAELLDFAWFNKNSAVQTRPVGLKRPNAWGLYDMHGNVWQRCRDWYDARYYAHSPTNDPGGPPLGTQRVSRGGGCDCTARHCRSAFRSHCLLEFRNGNLGFRVYLLAAEPLANGAKASTTGDAEQGEP
jgi:formylglycine-generating enzyme required for sulfatase activity